MRTIEVSLALVFLALLGSGGCASVQRVGDPARFIAQTHPQVVYVTYHNRSVMAVAQPLVRGDSLFGERLALSRPVAIPLSEVQSIHASQRDRKRTTLAIAGFSLIAAGGVYALINAGGRSNPSCDHSLGPGEQIPGCV